MEQGIVWKRVNVVLTVYILTSPKSLWNSHSCKLWFARRQQICKIRNWGTFPSRKFFPLHITVWNFFSETRCIKKQIAALSVSIGFLFSSFNLRLCRYFFYNFEEAQESIPRIDSTSMCIPAGRYNNLIPTRFLAAIHCKKRLTIFPPPAWMSLTKLSLAGNKLIIPGQRRFG